MMYKTEEGHEYFQAKETWLLPGPQDREKGNQVAE